MAAWLYWMWRCRRACGYRPVELRGRREDDIGQPGGIGHELLVDDGEEIFPQHAPR